jgi:hypothetical protein
MVEPVLRSLRRVIRRFAVTGGIQVERSSTASEDTDGNQVHGAPRTFTIKIAAVHPTRGRDLLLLPEGDRTTESIVVFTEERLRTALEGTREEADVVLYSPGGDKVRRYRVITAEDWTRQGGHYRSIAVKEEEP